MEDLREVFADNLLKLRTARHITQSHLAQVLNYSDKAVSKWERGESIPDVFILKQIADYFGVSVDYLLHTEHSEEEDRRRRMNAVGRRNRIVITLLASSLVWMIATFLFVVLHFTLPDAEFPLWLLYVYATPLSAVVLLTFNSVWGSNLKYNFLIISVIVWSLLASGYLTCYTLIGGGFWMIFVLGVPAQIIIFLWSRLNVRKS